MHGLFEEHPARPHDAFGEQHARFLPACQQVLQQGPALVERLAYEGTAVVGQEVEDHVGHRLLPAGVLDLGRVAELVPGQDGFHARLVWRRVKKRLIFLSLNSAIYHARTVVARGRDWTRKYRLTAEPLPSSAVMR